MTTRPVVILIIVAATGGGAAAQPAVRPPGAVELGPAGEGGPLIIDGGHVYWATHDDGAHEAATVRRAPLTGGQAEILARVGELGPADPPLAVVDGRVFVTAVRRAALRGRDSRAEIVRVAGGVARPLAHHRGVASASIVAHDGVLFWVAATPMGPGPIVSTDPRTGRTRPVAPCRDAEIDCSDWLPGAPPAVRVFPPGGGVGQLHPVTRRGLGPGVPAPADAVAVLDGHALCQAGWSGDGAPPPVTLAPLGGGLPMLAPGLDANTRALGRAALSRCQRA